jgi:glycosyltransferase involved in cell wall biosynthesis
LTDPTLSVLVPAFQESDSIIAALQELTRAVEKIPFTHEIIVIADGCTDDTANLVRSVAGPNLRLVEYQPNRGKGYALSEGFRESRGELVAFIDADLDINPDGLADLLDVMNEKHADVVVGSKVHRQSRVHYPYFRRLQSYVFRLIVRSLFSLSVTDSQTGLKLFRREVLDECLPHVRSEGFAFDLELLVAANDRGYRLAEGPVELDYKFSTTTGPRAVVSVLRDTLMLARRRRREKYRS